MSEQNKIEQIKAYVELCEEEGYDFQHLDNLKFLLQEIERKDEALRFYADEDNYEEGQLLQDPECGDWFNDPPKVIFDSGKHAREAL